MRYKILQPLKEEIIKKKEVAVFDIEARNRTEIVIIGYYDKNGYTYFNDVNSFLDFILKRDNAKINYYAHFGGRYDFLALIENLINRNLQLEPILSQSRIILLKIRKGKYTFNLIDSFNLLPLSLKEIGSKFGLEKKEFDFNTDFDDWDKLVDYNKRDCEVLYKAITEFQETINKLGGCVKLTLASTSLDLFRRKFLKTTVADNSNLEEYFRQAYYGGRCEVFKKYGSPCIYSDFNSLYPSVMKNSLMPIGKAYIIKTHNLEKYKDFPVAFVEATVLSPPPDKLYIPVLPYRYKGKLLFPTGEFTGWWDLELIKKAEEVGYIIKPSKIIVFNDYQAIFKEYIESLYNLRLEAKHKNDKTLDLVTKLLMNSLYGKFGQRREQEEIFINPDEEDIINLGLRPYLPYLEERPVKAYVGEHYSLASHIHPEISAHITALAQLKLYNTIQNALEKNIELYYTDTDSLFTDKEIENSVDLGRLKIEGKYEKAYFIYPKVYVLPNYYVKIKGFKTSKTSVLTLDENNVEKYYEIDDETVKKLLNKEETIVCKYIDIAPFKTSLRNSLWQTRVVEKKIKFDGLEKRYFQGYESLPWVIQNDELKAPVSQKVYSYLNI